MWFKRRPNTHALALWTLVLVCGFLLLVTFLYVTAMMRIQRSGAQVFPPKTQPGQQSLPTMFGHITTINADGSLSVDSKQAYTVVLTDEMTTFTTVSGGPFDRTSLRIGAVITATGKDAGGGKMLAEAVAVVENGTGQPSAVSLQPSVILNAPSDWSEWDEMPAFIGWGKPGAKYLFALRGYDLNAPAVSVELYGENGKIAERIELDVPGYKQLKPLNDFLKPGEAESKLREYGIAAGGKELFDNLEVFDNLLEGRFENWVDFDGVLNSITFEKDRGLVAYANATEYFGDVILVPVSKISFLKINPNADFTQSYWLSPDGGWLVAVFTSDAASGKQRSVHLIDVASVKQP